MNPFSENNRGIPSRDHGRVTSSRFGGKRVDEGALRHALALKVREERRKYILKRLIILMLILLMLLTGGFGAFPHNPVTAMFQQQVVSNVSSSYLEYLNSFLRAFHATPIEPPGQTAQTSFTSESGIASGSGIDVIGFLIDLFSSDEAGTPLVQAPPGTQEPGITNAGPSISESAAAESVQSIPPAQPAPLALPVPLPPIAAIPVPTTVTAAPAVSILPGFFVPPPTRRPTREPVVLVDTITTGIIGTTPADGTTNIWPNTDIVINFNEAVNVTDTSFAVDCAAAQTFTVAGSGTSTITLTPTGLLPFAATCTVTVIAANITDVDTFDPPDALAVDYTFTFTILSLANVSVTGTNPASGATGVATNIIITVTFDRSVSFTASAFTIDCDGLQTFNVAGFWGDTATLTPSASLPTNTICTVTVDSEVSGGVGDPPDVMAADYVFTFTTAAVVTDNAPAVTNTSPMDTWTIATLDDNIIITFTEPVNVDEVTFQSFTIDCGAGSLAHAVSGTTTAAATLDPAASLPSGATCTVTVVATQVSDVDTIDPPDTMSDGSYPDYTFSFSTP